jgi:hypothetical protein
MIPRTGLHAFHLLAQVHRNQIGLQADMRANAQAWQMEATSRVKPVAQLAGEVSAAASEYKRRLGWNEAIDLSPVLALIGTTREEFDANNSALMAVADRIASADKSTHQAIGAISAWVVETVDPVPALWPV